LLFFLDNLKKKYLNFPFPYGYVKWDEANTSKKQKKQNILHQRDREQIRMNRPLKMISLVSSMNIKNTQSKMSKIRLANVPRVKLVYSNECRRLVKKRRISDDDAEEDEDETGYYYFIFIRILLIFK
jgi:hypothetical protein